MARLLLTPGQVTVAVTSGTIILCTFALFLSGYAIQQRTVSKLRAAIRPDPSPRIYLPDRFSESTTELVDGTVVVLDTPQKEGLESEFSSLMVDKDQKQLDGLVIEIKPSIPEPAASQDDTAVVEDEVIVSSKSDSAPQNESESSTSEQSITVEQPAKAVVEPWQQKGDSTATSNTNLVTHPEEDTEELVSPAERRRLIKQEIQRLAKAEEPVYYQRRLW